MGDEDAAREDRRDERARSVLHRREPGARLSIFRAIGIELRIRPTVTSMTFASIFVGMCAMVMGQNASRAFIELGGQSGGALIAHVMGVALFLGGVAALAGIARLGSLVELLGLGLISAGAFIYAVAVFLGLGASGLIAGGLASGLSLGTALRVVLLTRAATRLYDDAVQQTDSDKAG
jgi:hypothetical protein